MYKLLESFWEWMPISCDEYATKGILQSSIWNEENFPQFNQLLVYAKCIISNNKIDKQSIEDLLMILGLDNESESVLENIVEESSFDQLQRIILFGIEHSFYHVRWQLAEIIYLRKPKDYKKYLLLLTNDVNLYVRKRAINCLLRLN